MNNKRERESNKKKKFERERERFRNKRVIEREIEKKDGREK